MAKERKKVVFDTNERKKVNCAWLEIKNNQVKGMFAVKTS